MSDNVSLIQRPDAALSTELTALARHFKSVLPNGNKLSDQEALAAAAYAKATGLDPTKGEFYVIPGRGIVPGYRGEIKVMAERTDYYYQFRLLTPEEAALHEIAEGDYAAVCEVYLPNIARQLRELGIPYRPVVGVGIVRRAEKYKAEEWRDTPQGRRLVKLDPPIPVDPPTGRSWHWKAQQRALKDALRHAGIEAPTIEEELAESDERGQAIVAEVNAQPPEVVQEQLQQRVEAMRGPQSDDPLGIDGPPTAPALTAEDIRQRLHRLATEGANWKQQPADARQEDFLKKAFGIAVPSDYDRQLVKSFLIGHEPPFTRGEVAAYTGWLDIRKDDQGRWGAGEQARQEIAILLRELKGPSLFEEVPDGDAA